MRRWREGRGSNSNGQQIGNAWAGRHDGEMNGGGVAAQGQFSKMRKGLRKEWARG